LLFTSLWALYHRLNAFCEEHSGGHKSLVRREGLDSMVISEAVHKEAWRESNAYRKDKPQSIKVSEPSHKEPWKESNVYRKDKPLSLKVPEPVEPEAFGKDSGSDSDSRSDTEDEESSVER
jgi:hypothetical protein